MKPVRNLEFDAAFEDLAWRIEQDHHIRASDFHALNRLRPVFLIASEVHFDNIRLN